MTAKHNKPSVGFSCMDTTVLFIKQCLQVIELKTTIITRPYQNNSLPIIARSIGFMDEALTFIKTSLGFIIVGILADLDN